jgi:hypothetical protein
MLLRLVYASRCAVSTADDLDATLTAIQAEAIPRNRALDVTGVLVAHDGWFVQVLEGPEDGVRSAYREIERDPRHAAVAVLAEEAAETRLFGRWSLGCRVASALDAAALKAIDRRPVFDPTTAPTRVVMRCLTVIAEAHRDKFDHQHAQAAA